MNLVMNGLKSLLILVLLCVFYSAEGQTRRYHLDMQLGLGSAASSPEPALVFLPLGIPAYGHLRPGIAAYLHSSADSARLSFFSGLRYRIRFIPHANTQLLSLPFGIAFTTQGKLQFQVGINLEFSHHSILTFSNLPLNYKIENWLISVGCHMSWYYPISTKSSLGIIWRNTVDLSSSWNYQQVSPGGGSFDDPTFGMDSYLSLGYRLRLNTK